MTKRHDMIAAITAFITAPINGKEPTEAVRQKVSNALGLLIN